MSAHLGTRHHSALCRLAGGDVESTRRAAAGQRSDTEPRASQVGTVSSGDTARAAVCRLAVIYGGRVRRWRLSLYIWTASSSYTKYQQINYCTINVTWGYTSVPAKWQLNPSNGLSRVQQCDNDRQRRTDGPRYRSI